MTAEKCTVGSLLICSHQIISGRQNNKNQMGGVCGRYGGADKCIQGLVDEPGGKRPYIRPRCRWEDNIKIGLKDSVGRETTDRFSSQQGQAGTSCELGSLEAEKLRFQATGRQHRWCIIPQAVNTV
jgi:hypothetical protein